MSLVAVIGDVGGHAEELRAELLRLGADRAAAAINSLIGTHEDVLFHAGQLLGSARPDLMAGPIWAAAGPELVSSWLGGPAPVQPSARPQHAARRRQEERHRRVDHDR